jgi:hypothetical protein
MSDMNALTEAFRSLGVVLGGRSKFLDHDMPGGYVFLSGSAEKMKLMIPLLRALLESGLSHSFEAVTRKGWELFYALNEEYRASAIPLYIGMKDGVLLMGSLDEEALEETSEFVWGAVGDGKPIFRAAADMEIMYTLFASFIPSRPFSALEGVIREMDLEDMLNARAFSGMIQAFTHMQEIKNITLDMNGWDSFDVSIFTGEVDYKKVYELSRLSRRLTIEELED